jgi:hypothetical protein
MAGRRCNLLIVFNLDYEPLLHGIRLVGFQGALR